MAEDPSEKRNIGDGEAIGATASVQPEDFSSSLVETEESTQMEEVGNASGQSEDNVSALGSEEENKAESNMLDAEVSGTTVSVQPEDLSMNLAETEERTQIGNASELSEDNEAIVVLGENEESKDQREHLSSVLSSEEENKAEDSVLDGEASDAIVSVQPEDLSRNLVETEEPKQMEDASDQSEDNAAIDVLGEKEESKDQQEHLSSALGSEEENKAAERNKLDGEASGTTVSVQPEDLSRNLVEIEEPTQIEQSEDNAAIGVLEKEEEESKGQQEHLSSAVTSPTQDPTVGGLDEQEAKCSIPESDIKEDGKKCVGSSESVDLNSEAPPEAANSISVPIEESSVPSNSLVSNESKAEKLKDV